MLKKKYPRVAIYFIGLLTIFGFFSIRQNEESKTHKVIWHMNDGCKSLLANLSTLEIGGIIVDLNFLDKVDQEGNFTIGYIKIAVNNESDNGYTTFNNYEVTVDIIVYFDDPAKDYLLFDDNGIHRAVPRMGFLNVANIRIPEDPQLFINYWNRSKMIECLHIQMNRTDTSRYLPIPHSFQQMAFFRNILVEYGMFPLLLDGSLLGWYRECSIIPHTKDVDFGVFIEQFNPQFEIDVAAWKTPFRMLRRLGMLNDSLEHTLVPKWWGYPHIDIFYLYKEKDQFWFGGTTGKLEKIRYYYPSVNSICSTDLGGFIFWVTCEPEKALKAAYGIEWRRDHPSSKFNWDESGANIKRAGNWSEEMRKDVYVIY